MFTKDYCYLRTDEEIARFLRAAGSLVVDPGGKKKGGSSRSPPPPHRLLRNRAYFVAALMAPSISPVVIDFGRTMGEPMARWMTYCEQMPMARLIEKRTV